MLIEFAFDVQPFQVSGGPAWMREYRYEIEARPPSTSKSSQANPSTPKAPLNEEQREMLQSLLMDRFQLQFHRETRQGPVYLLTLGNKELKLKEVKHESEFEWVGSVHGGGGINGDGLVGKNISMPVLAQQLSLYLKKPVFDQTGLNGFFDFEYKYDNNEVQPDVISCILTSLQGIGLKIKPSQGPVETIVIDHAEKPSAN
jgi:bla regulator protein BlaR1